MPRSLNAVQISWTYTFKPPLALLPRDAVGEVCMEMTAIRGAARPVTGPASSATVRRSRVKPASGNAAEAGAGDRRARTQNWKNLRRPAVFPPNGGNGARYDL